MDTKEQARVCLSSCGRKGVGEIGFEIEMPNPYKSPHLLLQPAASPLMDAFQPNQPATHRDSVPVILPQSVPKRQFGFFTYSSHVCPALLPFAAFSSPYGSSASGVVSRLNCIIVYFLSTGSRENTVSSRSSDSISICQCPCLSLPTALTYPSKRLGKEWKGAKRTTGLCGNA